MIAHPVSYRSVEGPGNDWPRMAERGPDRGEWIHRNRRIAVFVCACCHKRVPWSQGCWDDAPELCDQCYVRRPRGLQ